MSRFKNLNSHHFRVHTNCSGTLEPKRDARKPTMDDLFKQLPPHSHMQFDEIKPMRKK